MAADGVGDPQELMGVRVLFERAYAEDYVIQTWNGRDWVSQVNVTGNTLLERPHYFPPVTTTKLRIYVTSAPAFNMVSIWELEAYITPTISTKVSVPREGRYMFALRLVSSPDHGTLSLKVNNFTATISCFSPSLGFEWREVGPIHLNASDHAIAVSSVGKIDLDEMVIYSLKDKGRWLP
ncbi:MAG: hypothetical protein AOA65_1617 [Candidatus Bathyarchaeota archaeon BA1]|nr:MAG: hypothetical protein AOA65_1617 [Candidatus Bathyarchaeota archaeon BA1]